MSIPNATPPDSYEAWRIQIVSYLAGELRPDEVKALSGALRASPELRDALAELAKHQVLLGELGETVFAAVSSRTHRSYTSTSGWAMFRRHARYAVAAILLVGLFAGGVALYRQQGGAITAVNKAVNPAGDAPTKQNEVVNRGPQTLASGLAQLQLENGVTLLIEGPARFRIDTPLKVLLENGKLTAKVPANAHGFTVLTPAAQVVDLGTEFGVEVRPDSSTYTEVYLGNVQVYALNSPTPLNTMTQLAAGKAANVHAGAALVTPGDYVPENFARDISQSRHPIPLFSTGLGLKEGNADPHWQVVKEDFNVQFVPQQAVVSEYSVNDPVRSQWISLRGVPKTDPPDPSGMYTFKTTVDLAGFDPSTVLIHAHIVVDDGIDDILINGQSTRQKLPKRGDHIRPTGDFTLRGGFRAGVNEVEFVVEKKITNIFNPVMLRVEWDGTAARASGQ